MDSMRIIRQAAIQYRFRSDQVLRLFAVMRLEAEKLAALSILASRLVDPENARELERVFTSDWGRQRARQILRVR